MSPIKVFVRTAFQTTMSDHIDSLIAIVNDVIQREGTIWVKMASWFDRHGKFVDTSSSPPVPPPDQSTITIYFNL